MTVSRSAYATLPAMLAAIHSAAVLGIDAVPVLVEVDAAKGLPQWTLCLTLHPQPA
jgi:hypothetical protein